MSRIPFVAGNWKMNKTASETGPFVAEMLGLGLPDGVDVAVCPPYTSLHAAVAASQGSNLCVFAQNMHEQPRGAFTGEISAAMLLDLDVDGVLLGHSERRQYFNETDEVLNMKVAAAHAAGLQVILCVGELESQHEAGQTEEVLRRQVETALDGLGDERIAMTTIAYEPVWAIGTGRTATPEMAQEAHAFIRSLLPAEARDQVRIQYGGSMKPENAAELLNEPDIDGGLIGGASLAAGQFAAIVAAAV
ncbi:MAG: triosephosphate isomerase [Gaiellales bacterium]|nr:triosephosphate isomerase [Gaiellales bacterium]